MSTQTAAPRSIKVFGRTVPLPQSRLLRIVLGLVLCFGGFLGFLPILGFWMLPLGLLVLSYEFHFVRKFRRRLIVWWERRKQKRDA